MFQIVSEMKTRYIFTFSVKLKQDIVSNFQLMKKNISSNSVKALGAHIHVEN